MNRSRCAAGSCRVRRHCPSRTRCLVGGRGGELHDFSIVAVRTHPARPPSDTSSRSEASPPKPAAHLAHEHQPDRPHCRAGGRARPHRDAGGADGRARAHCARTGDRGPHFARHGQPAFAAAGRSGAPARGAPGPAPLPPPRLRRSGAGAGGNHAIGRASCPQGAARGDRPARCGHATRAHLLRPSRRPHRRGSGRSADRTRRSGHRRRHRSGDRCRGAGAGRAGPALRTGLRPRSGQATAVPPVPGLGRAPPAPGRPARRRALLALPADGLAAAVAQDKGAGAHAAGRGRLSRLAGHGSLAGNHGDVESATDSHGGGWIARAMAPRNAPCRSEAAFAASGYARDPLFGPDICQGAIGTLGSARTVGPHGWRSAWFRRQCAWRRRPRWLLPSGPG